MDLGGSNPTAAGGAVVTEVGPSSGRAKVPIRRARALSSRAAERKNVKRASHACEPCRQRKTKVPV